MEAPGRVVLLLHPLSIGVRPRSVSPLFAAPDEVTPGRIQADDGTTVEVQCVLDGKAWPISDDLLRGAKPNKADRRSLLIGQGRRVTLLPGCEPDRKDSFPSKLDKLPWSWKQVCALGQDDGPQACDLVGWKIVRD